MCGIAGAWSASADPAILCRVRKMAEKLAHRGPDAIGIWVDDSAGMHALGHARLAIQDLTPSGAQPMVSAGGRFVIALNGEIYNHWELRDRLGGRRNWRGRSDTETLLECISEWGVRTTLNRVNGMFAFALWDRVTHRLTLARDRSGEKPLYWGMKDGVLIFASELGAILESGFGPFHIEPESVAALLNLGYIPDPLSILRNILKLEPGHVIEFRLDGGRIVGDKTAYWRFVDVLAAAVSSRTTQSDAEWEEEVETALERSVRLRLISDVPVGAFLSGGVDSALIVAMMAKVVDAPVRTFTVAMPAVWDESPRARRLAEYLGTDHTEIGISDQDCLEIIPKLPTIYTEPFGDSSQVPTYVVSAAARREVTVVLSGDGGDELFAGYHRHFQARRVWNGLSRLPRPVHRVLASMAGSNWGRRAIAAASVMASGGGVREGRMLRIQKAGRLVAARSVADLYLRLVTQWPMGQAPLAVGQNWTLALPGEIISLDGLDPVEQLMAFDICTSLPGDMLVKVDRAAMAHALEVRVPFLDHELVELAMRVPPSLKIQGGQGKVILRRILSRHAPPGWMEAPEAKRKTGFGIPLAAWLRNELREWAESLLTTDLLQSNPFLDERAVRARWKEFLEENISWEHPLWSVLMLQAWLQTHQRWLTIE